MKMNFKGLVSLHTLPKTTPLLPLYEAVINSIQSIEDAHITKTGYVINAVEIVALISGDFYVCKKFMRSVGLYFLLRPYVGTETVSWICILGAALFAMMGFVRYHGMNAEQFVWAFIKSEFLLPKRLIFQPENLYMETVF